MRRLLQEVELRQTHSRSGGSWTEVYGCGFSILYLLAGEESTNQKMRLGEVLKVGRSTTLHKEVQGTAL